MSSSEGGPAVTTDVPTERPENIDDVDFSNYFSACVLPILPVARWPPSPRCFPPKEGSSHAREKRMALVTAAALCPRAAGRPGEGRCGAVWVEGGLLRPSRVGSSASMSRGLPCPTRLGTQQGSLPP